MIVAVVYGVTGEIQMGSSRFKRHACVNASWLVNEWWWSEKLIVMMQMYGIDSHVVDGVGHFWRSSQVQVQFGQVKIKFGPNSWKVCDSFRDFDWPNLRLVIKVATVTKFELLIAFASADSNPVDVGLLGSVINSLIDNLNLITCLILSRVNLNLILSQFPSR